MTSTAARTRPLPPVDERQLMSAYEQGVRFENNEEATHWAEAYAREDRLDELRFLLEHGCTVPWRVDYVSHAAPRCLKYLIQYYMGSHKRGDGRPIDGAVASLKFRGEGTIDTRFSSYASSVDRMMWDFIRQGDCERLQVLYECKLVFRETIHFGEVRRGLFIEQVLGAGIPRVPRERVLAWYAGLPHREPHLHQEWYENLKRACTTKEFIDTMKFIAENDILPERLLRRLRPADEAESDMDNDIRAYLTDRYASRKELVRTMLELVDKSKDGKFTDGDYMQIANTCKLLYNE